MRPDLFLATIGRGSNGSNALEVTEDRAAVTAESQDNIINRVNNVSQYGPSWHYVPGIGVAGTAYAEVPGSALGDLAFTRASSKTRTNSAGVVETIGNNVPPHDYRNADGTLSAFPRLNLEPQRTNSIRNSSMVGAVAGSPGTLPTNWSTVLAGLTQTVVGTGTESGLPYIDIRFNGTATAVNVRTLMELNTIAAANGQTWSESIYIKTISGTLPTPALRMTFRSSGGSLLGSAVSNLSQSATLQRYTFTHTIATATTAFIDPEIQFTTVSGQTYDFTVRIAAPQMELGAYATTWLPTTTAAVTRIADLANKTGVSTLIGQTEGTIFVEGSFAGIASNIKRFFTLSDGSTNNEIIIQNTAATNSIQFVVTQGGVSQASIVLPVGSMQFGVNFKAAFAYKENDFVAYFNGAQVGTDTSGTVPNCSKIVFGRGNDTTLHEGAIRQSAIFKSRLTNAQLAQMTTL